MQLYNSEDYYDNSFKYNYYRRDHLGNNREVWRAPFSSGNTNFPAATIQRTQYYPSGLPWASNTGDRPGTQNKKHNGTEFIEMHGFDVSDHGNRGLFHAINRYTSIDRFCEKFPWQSPYVHAGNNPVNYVDVMGDSINMKDIQRFDNVNKSNYTNTIINDLNSETGLTTTISQNGDITYSKDKNGNPVIGTQTDKNGNVSQLGSKTARDLIIKAIDSKDMLSVSTGARSGAVSGTNTIGLNFKQIDGFIKGSVNLDNRTLGYGMTLMHEILHTNIGGGLSDSPFNPGPVVNTMNTIRSELNAQGGNYGERMDYYGTQQSFKVILPFNSTAQKALQAGWTPVLYPTSKFITF